MSSKAVATVKADLKPRKEVVIGFDPERQQQESAGDEKQDVDCDNRADGHPATRSQVTSTNGFLPVHRVAQRRTASRTASRTPISIGCSDCS